MKFLAANIKEGERDWLCWTWKLRWWVAGFFALWLILIIVFIILRGKS